MIYTAIDNFYVSEEDLVNKTPSRKDGVSFETETQLRIYGCELVQEGGILLKLPQAVMATGQVLLHRFYCKESLLKFNIKRVAWSCCWLATKLEETPRRIRDLLSVFYRMDRRREGRPLTPLDIYSKEYDKYKQELINVERNLLRTFGFILHVDHPHKFVLNYLMLLDTPKELLQEAWNIANDSLRTTLCVRFKGESVACGIIFMAARRLKVPLPEDPPWWELFDVKKADMYTVCRELQALYDRPKVAYISVWKEKKAAPSPRGGGAGEAETTPQVSPANKGTPALSGTESDKGTSSVRAARDAEGLAGNSNDRSKVSVSEGAALEGTDADARRREKRERGNRERSARDGGDEERRKRRHRDKEALAGERGAERRPDRDRERDRERKRDRRENGREQERERDRERKALKERDRERGYSTGDKYGGSKERGPSR